MASILSRSRILRFADFVNFAVGVFVGLLTARLGVFGLLLPLLATSLLLPLLAMGLEEELLLRAIGFGEELLLLAMGFGEELLLVRVLDLETSIGAGVLLFGIPCAVIL